MTHKRWLAVCVATLPLLSGCAAVQKAVTECVTDNAASKVVSAALSSEKPREALTETAKTVGFEVVTCALWSIVRSLTGNAQASSVEAFQPDPWKARKEHEQPKVDAAREWLRSHNQTMEPAWKLRR